MDLRLLFARVAAAVAAIVVAAVAVGVATGQPGVPLVAVGAAGAVVAAAATATRRQWGRRARIGGVGVGVAATGAAVVVSGVAWAIPVALVTGGGWFVARTLWRSVRPAAEMPHGLAVRLERVMTLSDESIAGMRIGARADGAVVAVAYLADAGDTARRARFRADVEVARGVLGASGITTPTFLGVVDDETHFERDGEIVIAGGGRLADAVAGASAPRLDDVLSIAAESGITLNRAQQRAVAAHHRPGRSGAPGGKKVVHRGRVTKSEP